MAITVAIRTTDTQTMLTQMEDIKVDIAVAIQEVHSQTSTPLCLTAAPMIMDLRCSSMCLEHSKFTTDIITETMRYTDTTLCQSRIVQRMTPPITMDFTVC